MTGRRRCRGGLFVDMARAQHALFAQRRAEQLQADGQALLVEPARHREAADAGQAGRQGEDIFEIHGQRVVGVGADAEGGGGRDRRGDDIDLRKGLVEVAADGGAHLLGLPIIGVVVAGQAA